ncbi:cupin domain-containing protein [Niveibacterium sp. SC-1]|uniref:cupin domain-containing protein n=1 Tax=Niveibacterium sp. SC-1 TaxID=3135646 RepID=UPI00311EAC7C
MFESRRLPAQADEYAPDGSEVRRLLRVAGGSMAHFRLAPGQTSSAVMHRSVEEIWYVLEGRGEIWRSQDGAAEIVALEPGLCLTIPLGTCFQFRAAPDEPVSLVAVTLPPWPGDDEAIPVAGAW